MMRGKTRHFCFGTPVAECSQKFTQFLAKMLTLDPGPRERGVPGVLKENHQCAHLFKFFRHW